MTTRFTMLLLALLALCVPCLSCGSSIDSLPAAGQSDSAQNADTPDSVIGEALSLSSGLPALATLAGAEHAVSIAGPGWQRIAPYVEGGFAATMNAVKADGNLELSGPDLAYAVYPVIGFDGDSFPTSLRLGILGAGTGSYYVAAADFARHRWTVLGPYNGAATVEFPGISEAGPHDTYVSEYGRCFVALLTEAGAKFEFNSIELGVSGGIAGPRPPSLLSAPTGSTRLSISWVHSPDLTRPDFAGYQLDRAPLLSGDFQQLGNGLIEDSSFLDEGVEQSKSYRYRLRAVDSSGNYSLAVNFQGTSAAASLNNPVLVVRGPQGPLYGPVNVEYDLISDSYDPEGIGITTYGVSSPALGFQTLVDGKLVTTLQPGNHMLQFTIQTSDFRLANQFMMIRVLPVWEENPQIVADTPLLAPARMKHLSGLISPFSGFPTFAGYDASLQAVGLWQQKFGGPDENQYLLPAYWPVDNLSRAISFNNGLLLAAAMHDNFWLARFDEGEAEWISGPPRSAGSAMDLVALDISQGWLVCEGAGFFSDNLLIYRLDNLAVPEAQFLDVGDIQEISCCYSEQTGQAHVFVRTDTNVTWLLLDFGATTLDSGGVLNSGAFTDMQAVIDPQTGRPALMLFDGKYRFTAMDGAGSWPALQTIDSLEDCRPGGSIAAADRLYAVFARNSGQTRVYAFDGAGWNVRADVGNSPDAGLATAMLDAQGANGTELDIADTTAEGELRFIRVLDDNTSNQISTLPPSLGQGTAMHACSSSGGELQLCWNNAVLSSGEIRHSSDGGNSWGVTGGMLARNLSNGSDSLGNIYYGTSLLGSAILFRWDGSSLVNQWLIDPSGLETIPILAKRTMSQDTLFYAHTAGSGLSSIVTGHFDSGTPALDYSVSTLTPQIRPVWEGAANVIGDQTRIFASAGGSEPSKGSLLLYNGSTAKYNMLVEHPHAEPLNFMAQPLVRGRSLASCSFLGEQIYLSDQVFFSTYGDNANAMRYVVDYSGEAHKHDLALEYDPWRHDARRTVSCDSTPGLTGLVIMSDLEGRDIRLEWSNFGEWEGLPVPQPLKGMSMHEIVVGSDGRWHVFYRDRYTDQVWMLSTQ
jgi:hypothetical protein